MPVGFGFRGLPDRGRAGGIGCMQPSPPNWRVDLPGGSRMARLTFPEPYGQVNHCQEVVSGLKAGAKRPKRRSTTSTRSPLSGQLPVGHMYLHHVTYKQRPDKHRVVSGLKAGAKRPTGAAQRRPQPAICQLPVGHMYLHHVAYKQRPDKHRPAACYLANSLWVTCLYIM